MSLQPPFTVTRLEGGWDRVLGGYVACPWCVPVDGSRGDKSCEIEGSDIILLETIA